MIPLPVPCSANLAMKPSTLGGDQFVDAICNIAIAFSCNLRRSYPQFFHLYLPFGMGMNRFITIRIQSFFFKLPLPNFSSCHSGVAKFHGSFVFNRKRNIVELEIKQDMSRGTAKYVV